MCRQATLKEQLVKAYFRIKHLALTLPSDAHPEIDVSLAEFELMEVVSENAPDREDNTHICDIQAVLHISKAGVSKMLGVLERKGYLHRDIDKNDRRTLIITLTGQGREVLAEMKKSSAALLEKIIAELGSEQAKQFVSVTNRFVDAWEGTCNKH